MTPSGPAGASRRFLFVGPRQHTNQQEWLRALLDAGHRVEFVALHRGPTESYDLVEPHVFGFGPLFGVVRTAIPDGPRRRRLERRLGLPRLGPFARFLLRYRPEIVIARRAGALPVLALACAHMLGARFVLYDQLPLEDGLAARSRLGTATWRAVARITGREVLAMTPVRRGSAARAQGPGWTKAFVRFVAPQATPRPPRRSSPGALRILAVGKFERRKNHLLLVDAFAVAARGSDASLTIVGECSTEDHRRHHEAVAAHVRARGLDERVRLRTNVAFGEMAALYEAHDACVLAASNEPASISVLEALAHGLPVLTTETNGTSSYVHDLSSGERFAPDDPAALTDALRRWLHDPERVRAMGDGAARSARCDWSPSAFRRDLGELLGLVLEPAASPSR